MRRVVNLTANTTIGAITPVFDGQHLEIILIQDATGGRVVTWDATFKHPPPVNPLANSITRASFFSLDATNWWCDEPMLGSFQPASFRDPWVPGGVGGLNQNMARSQAVGATTVATAATQYLIGGFVCMANRTYSAVNFQALVAGSNPSVSWMALARQSDRVVQAHTANITTAPASTSAPTSRSFTAAYTPTSDTPVWVVFSYAATPTALQLLGNGITGSAAATLISPALWATNGVSPTTTVPTDGTTVITAATTGQTIGVPLVWLS